MKYAGCIPQVGGWNRYLYECPRGTIAINEIGEGDREIVRCLGGSDLTKRDEREALKMHLDILEEDEDDEDGGIL